MNENLAWTIIICFMCLCLTYCTTSLIKEENKSEVLQKQIELYNLTNKQK